MYHLARYEYFRRVGNIAKITTTQRNGPLQYDWTKRKKTTNHRLICGHRFHLWS